MNKIKELRKQKKISQEETSKLLNIPIATYIRYEQEETQPTATAIIKLADFYNVSCDYLLGRQFRQIDTSFASEKQKSIITNILQLDDDEIELVEAYIAGLMSVKNKTTKIG